MTQKNSQGDAVRDALVGLLNTIHRDLAWADEQPYRSLVYRSIARAYLALGEKPTLGVGTDLRAAIDKYFEAAIRDENKPA